MRKRLLPFVLLGLSLAFLLVPSFRWVLEIALRDHQFTIDLDNLDAEAARERETALPASQVTALLERASRERNPRLLAFVALTSSSPSEALRAADEVYALDPSYAWVGYYLLPIKQDADANTRWVAHLKAFDPENAVVYLREAECVQATHPDFPRLLKTPAGWKHPDPSPLVPQTEWLAVMEKAYAAPHYHSYENRRFMLERDVMQQLGRATPWKLVALFQGQRMPNLATMRDLAYYKVYYVAEKAQRARQFDTALQQIQQTAAFGQRLQTEGRNTLERLFGQSIDNISAEGQGAWLQAQGRKSEAEMVVGRETSYTRANVTWRHAEETWESQLALDFIYTHLLAYLYLILGALSALALLFGLLRPGGERWFDSLAAAAAKVAAVFMIFTAVVLLVTYAPYARNFNWYMDTPDTLYLRTAPLDLEDFPRDVAPTRLNIGILGKLSG